MPPRSRQHLAIKVRERLRERITPFMRMCCGRRVHMDIMVQQELLQHLPRRE